MSKLNLSRPQIRVGSTSRNKATFTRAASATQYGLGDVILPTPAAPISWSLGDDNSGRITGASCVVTAASGTIVLTALAIDLYLFEPYTDVPYPAASVPADNAPAALLPAAMDNCIGLARFTNAGWLNNVGSNAAAGTFLYQCAALSTVGGRPFASFNTFDLNNGVILGVPVVRDVWNPGNVAQTFDFILDVEMD